MPSAAYHRAVAEATAHHASSKTYSGKLMRPHKPVLSEIIDRLDIESALDYGCGKGRQYDWIDPEDGKTLEQAWGFSVAKHDPCWPAFVAEPVGKFDLVICTHVLGSIPLEDLDWALARIFGFANKAVYFAEKIGEIKKTAISVPGRPTDWLPNQWLQAVTPHARKFQGEVHFSFRTREDDGVFIDRHIKRPRKGWQTVTNRASV